MNQDLADRIIAANKELLEKGDAEAAHEYFAQDYVVHITGQDGRGVQLVKGFVSELRSAFPDLRVEVEVLAGNDDRIAWQRTNRATHQGPFRGFPASGRPLEWREVMVSRFEGDKIAEEWAVSDLAERLLLARK